MIIVIVLLDDNRYHAFYAVKDSEKLQLSCVNHSVNHNN